MHHALTAVFHIYLGSHSHANSDIYSYCKYLISDIYSYCKYSNNLKESLVLIKTEMLQDKCPTLPRQPTGSSTKPGKCQLLHVMKQQPSYRLNSTRSSSKNRLLPNHLPSPCKKRQKTSKPQHYKRQQSSFTLDKMMLFKSHSRPPNNLSCVGWDVKPYLIITSWHLTQYIKDTQKTPLSSHPNYSIGPCNCK